MRRGAEARFIERADLLSLLRELEEALLRGRLTLRALGARLLGLAELLGKKYDSVSAACQAALRRVEREGRGPDKARGAGGAERRGGRDAPGGSSSRPRPGAEGPRRGQDSRRANRKAGNQAGGPGDRQTTETLALSADTTLLLTRSNPEAGVAQAAGELGDRLSRLADEQLQRSLRSSLAEEDAAAAAVAVAAAPTDGREGRGIARAGGGSARASPDNSLLGAIGPDLGELRQLLPASSAGGAGDAAAEPAAAALAATGLSEDVRGGLRAEPGRIVPGSEARPGRGSGGGLRRFSARTRALRSQTPRSDAPDLSEGAFSLGDGGLSPGPRPDLGARGGSGITASGSDEILVLSGVASSVASVASAAGQRGATSRAYALLQAMGSLRLRPPDSPGLPVPPAPGKRRPRRGPPSLPSAPLRRLFDHGQLNARPSPSAGDALRLRCGLCIGPLTFRGPGPGFPRGTPAPSLLALHNGLETLQCPQRAGLGLRPLRFLHRPNYSACAGKNLELMRAHTGGFVSAPYGALEQAEIWPVSDRGGLPAPGGAGGAGDTERYPDTVPAAVRQSSGEIPLLSGLLEASEGRAAALLDFPPPDRELPFSDFSGVPEGSEGDADAHARGAPWTSGDPAALEVPGAQGAPGTPRTPGARAEPSSEPGSVGAALAGGPRAALGKEGKRGQKSRKGRVFLDALLATSVQSPQSLTSACAALPYRDSASLFAEFLLSRSRAELEARQDGFLQPIWVLALPRGAQP